jgi:hypothetical protein
MKYWFGISEIKNKIKFIFNNLFINLYSLYE